MTQMLAKSLLKADYNVISYGKIYYPSPAPLWTADFEEGDFSDILKPWGGMLAEEYGGDVSIISGPTLPFKGTHYLRCEVPQIASGITRAMVYRWQETNHLTEFYFGAAFYIPDNFIVTDWVLIMQLHEDDDDPQLQSSGILASLELDKNTQRIRLVSQNPKWSLLWLDNENCPKNRWFSIVMHIIALNEGKVEVWIDGKLKVSIIGNFKPSTPGANPGPSVSTGIYQGLDPAHYLLIDNMIVSDNLQTALNYLS